MKTNYLCCEGDFDNLTVKHYAENSQAAIAYLNGLTCSRVTCNTGRVGNADPNRQSPVFQYARL